MTALLFPLVCFAADLTTKDGKTYKEYSVYKVSKRGIQIMHAEGECTVPFDQLPDDVREKYRSQEEKFTAEQNQRKMQRERQSVLKNIELLLYEDSLVEKVVDEKTCLVSTKYSFNEFVVEDIDTSNLSDGCEFPYLDTYYVNQRHSFYVYQNKCQHCNFAAPNISDYKKLKKVLAELEKKQCSKESRMRKRHRLYYIGSRSLRGRKYMLFTLNAEKALAFVKSNPGVRVPKLKDAPTPTVILSTPVGPSVTRPSPGVSPNSMQGQMLQNRRF